MTDDTNLPAADIATSQHRLDAAVADTKDKVAQWIELNTARGRGGALTIALLEIAIERQLRFSNEKEAFAFVQGVFNKVMRNRRRTIQPTFIKPYQHGDTEGDLRIGCIHGRPER